MFLICRNFYVLLGVEDGIDLDFLYPESDAVAINFSQLRNPGTTASSSSTTTPASTSSRSIILNRRPNTESVLQSSSSPEGFIVSFNSNSSNSLKL